MNQTAILILGILAVLATIIAALFNSIISRKNRVGNAIASVDAMLKKRYDLIPNLLSAVQKYMAYEQQLLKEITGLRAKAISSEISDKDRVSLDNRISRALRNIIAVAENYPDLKASGNFLHLQKSLNEVEEQISAARRTYNAAVTDYNIVIEIFPVNLIARIMGYTAKPWFEIPAEERNPITIK